MMELKVVTKARGGLRNTYIKLMIRNYIYIGTIKIHKTSTILQEHMHAHTHAHTHTHTHTHTDTYAHIHTIPLARNLHRSVLLLLRCYIYNLAAGRGGFLEVSC